MNWQNAMLLTDDEINAAANQIAADYRDLTGVQLSTNHVTEFAKAFGRSPVFRRNFLMLSGYWPDDWPQVWDNPDETIAVDPRMPARAEGQR